MVREIADIYGLSREEKYDLFESLNLDDYNRFEGPITEVVSISGKKAAEYIAEKLNIRSDSRRCLANCFGHSWCQILYKSRSIFCVSKKTWWKSITRMQTSCQTTLKGDNMQAINPNMNIGFRQNQTDKNIKKKTLVIENSLASSTLTTLSYIAGVTSLPILSDGVGKLKQEVNKHKLDYSLILLMTMFMGIGSFKV